jgi:peptidoglycan/LPS O-acetylase OafA/YrhL
VSHPNSIHSSTGNPSTGNPSTGNPSSKPSTVKLEALTGLRLFLALNIINYHFGQPLFVSAPWWLRNFVEAGYVGTGFFFVLSGFVISYVYLDPHGKRKLEPRKFLIARFSRLYPIYLLGIIAWLPFLPEKLLEGPRTAFTVFGTLLTVPTLTQSWFPGVACVWNCPGWSTSADLSMYLLFPLIATHVYPRIAASHFKPFALWLTGFWLLALVPPSLYMFAEASGEFGKGYAFWLTVLKYHPLSRLPEFMVGVVLAKRFAHDLETAWLERGRRRLGLASLGSAGIVVMFAVMAFASSFPYPLLHNGLLLPVVALVAYSFAAGVGPVSRWLEYKPFQQLGETSFCMYILHNPIFEYLYRGLTLLGVNTGEGKATWFFALYIGTVMFVSWFAYHRIEVPARDRLRRWLEPGQVWRSDIHHWLLEAGLRGRRVVRPALLVLASLSLTVTGTWMARAWGAPNISPNVSRDVLLEGSERPLQPQTDGWLAPQPIKLETAPSTLYLHENEYAPGLTLFAQFTGNHAGVMVGSKYAVMLNGEYLIWGTVRLEQSSSRKLEIAGISKTKTGSSLHALEVGVRAGAIQARLDGALLLKSWRVPLESGRVGLIASSPETFSKLEVVFSNASTDEARTGNAVDINASGSDPSTRLRERFDRPPSEANWRVLAGDWALEDAAFVQRDRSGYDRALEHRDSFVPPYKIKTRFRHLSGSGAGVLFGLPDAELGLNAGRGDTQMVRYADDGRSLLWGFFDARGAFIGQGYAPTPAPGNTWHELEVQVEKNSYSVALDGQALQAGIPVKRASGRIALQTSLSSAAFDLLEVQAESPVTNPVVSNPAKPEKPK